MYLISGPMAAGKTTVARLLAEGHERGVHLEGDVFRRNIVSGRKDIRPDPSPEALAQLRLRYRLAAAAADTYADSGFSVALEDVVAGELLGEYRRMIRTRPCHVVVLLPSVAALKARAAGRVDHGYHSWTVEELHNAFEHSTPRTGVWLDTTDLTPEETVDAILAQTPPDPDPIVVVAYDTRWPKLFEELAAPVRDAVARLGARVEHVGSTAVPGLAAKPVIDLDVIVPSVGAVPLAIERLRPLGYVHQGDLGIAGREAFKSPPDARPHHLYVIAEGSPPLVDHIAFRDYLRRNPDATAEYASLKFRLAKKHRNDRLGYTEGKNEFISAILAAARRT